MKVSILTVLVCASFIAFSQDKPKPKRWTKTAELSLNLSQASFTNNWKGGGTNNISGLATANINANYKNEKTSWDNKMNLQYGMLKNNGDFLRKSNDMILIDSKFGRELNKKFNLFASVNFLSQFDKGYNFAKDGVGVSIKTEISSFMSPAYLTEAVGIEYKPNKYFNARIGLGSTRQTFVLNQNLYSINDSIKYGVLVGKKVRNDIGFQVISNYDKNFFKDMLNIKLKYLGFWGYKDLGNPKYWNHRVDLIMTAKISKYIGLTLNAVLLYDYNQSNLWQRSQILGLGFSYKL